MLTEVHGNRPYGSMCKDFPCKAEDLNNAVNLFPLVTCDRGWDKPKLVLGMFVFFPLTLQL